MEPHNIDNLITKYFDGDTSLQEEKTLKDYFSKVIVAPHLETYKPLFNFIKTEKEQKSTTLSMPQNNKKRNNWVAISAAVCLFSLGMLWIYDAQVNQIEPEESIQDPELAYQETKKALLLVSENLNKGMNKTVYLSEFNKSKNLIFKNQ
uniref:hypothetical protein n=1 Tax=Flavobacterium sp. TaxID=239 RepID=UPI00404AFE13